MCVCVYLYLYISWNSNILAAWRGELTHLKRPWCWERLKAGGEGDNRGWDGWMASLTWWTWVWVNSRSWWWTGRPGMLLFMGLQRIGHDWAFELNWTDVCVCVCVYSIHSFPFNSWSKWKGYSNLSLRDLKVLQLLFKRGNRKLYHRVLILLNISSRLKLSFPSLIWRQSYWSLTFIDL